MSTALIDRWNATLLERVSEPSSKRTRDEEDDISIVSRTTSPEPMDVDSRDIGKYDEYARGAEKEVITVDTKINSSNKGFNMLTKLGWSEGQPLGISGDGRVEPVPFLVKSDLTGLGKSSQDARMIESTVSQRRVLDSERQRKETEDQRVAREDLVARQAFIQSEVSETLKAFYCAVCEKQFTKVAQYDEHCNSYSHHHKIRFRDQQASQRAQTNSREVLDKRREKERKREEKELRKVAKAAGVKITTATPIVQAVLPAEAPIDTAGQAVASGFSAGTWASVTSAPAATNSFKKAGWATVDSTRAVQDTAPPPPALPSAGNSFSGFRSGGWTTLQPSAVSTPSPITANEPPAPSQGGWAPMNATTTTTPSVGGCSGSAALPQEAPHNSSQQSAVTPAAPRTEAGRSGWRQFKLGGKQ